MSLPAPFVAVAATPLNVRPVPKVSKPLPPHRFFFTTIPAPGAGKFRVPSAQLFPEEKENLRPTQAKATNQNRKKRFMQKKKKEQQEKRHYLGTKIAEGEYKTNLAPIPIDENTSIQLSFIIKKNNF